VKKLVIIASFLLIFVSSAWAGPYLVCDPQAGVQKYDVEINGDIQFPEADGHTNFPAEVDGAVKYDLQGLENGTHNIRLRCANLWGWSDWSEILTAVVQVCGTPQNLRIEP
jgi:hypothetical protein